MLPGRRASNSSTDAPRYQCSGSSLVAAHAAAILLSYLGGQASGGARVSAASLATGGSVTVSITVTHSGDRARDELVQVYAHDRSEVVRRARLELVGFAGAGLTPGESRDIAIEVHADDLRFWDVRSHDWALPHGLVDLEVARSSEHIEAVITITVAGDATGSAEPPRTPPIAASDEQWQARIGHEIAAPPPARPYTRESTVGDIGRTLAGRAVRSATRRMLPVSDDDRADPVSMALIARSLDELPLRGLAQMSGGRVSWAVVDAVVAFANRRPITGVRALLARS